MYQIVPKQTRPHRHPRQTSPFITASKCGYLVINKPAMEALQRHGATHVQLLFDAEQRLIAVKPTTDKQNTFRLNYRRAQVRLNSPRFWEYVGVRTEQGAQRFPAVWDNDSKMLVASV